MNAIGVIDESPTFAQRVASVNTDEVPLPVYGGGLFDGREGKWMV